MVNASFVFGMDEDDPTVFDRTVEWAVSQGIETATFHILTPYPGTPLWQRMDAEGRILHRNWDRYDTRHAVFHPRGMSVDELEAGYRRAYRDFYRWNAIWKSATAKPWPERLRHLAYAGGWKKFEPLWDWIIRMTNLPYMLPLLEAVLRGSEPRDQESTKIPGLRVTGHQQPVARSPFQSREQIDYLTYRLRS
jgi:hypothetical protein